MHSPLYIVEREVELQCVHTLVAEKAERALIRSLRGQREHHGIATTNASKATGEVRFGMLYAFGFEHIGVVVSDLYFLDPNPSVGQEGAERGVRLEVRML